MKTVHSLIQSRCSSSCSGDIDFGRAMNFSLTSFVILPFQFRITIRSKSLYIPERVNY